MSSTSFCQERMADIKFADHRRRIREQNYQSRDGEQAEEDKTPSMPHLHYLGLEEY